MISPTKKKRTKASTMMYASIAGGSSGLRIVEAKDTASKTNYERLEYEDELIAKDSVTVHTSTSPNATSVSEEHTVKLTETFSTAENDREDKDDGVETSASPEKPKKARSYSSHSNLSTDQLRKLARKCCRSSEIV